MQIVISLGVEVESWNIVCITLVSYGGDPG